MRYRSILILLCASVLLPWNMHAARVLLLVSGDVNSDHEAQRAIEEHGHTVTVGPNILDFTGSQVNIASYDVTVVVYPLTGAPNSLGVLALRSYLIGGGRLITTQPFDGAIGNSSPLRLFLPIINANNLNGGGGQTTYASSEPDVILNNGVADSFTFSISRQAYFTLHPSTKVYYTSRSGQYGLVGRILAGGARILSFGTTIGSAELQNPDLRRLFGNAVDWAVVPSPAPAKTSDPAHILLLRSGITDSDREVQRALEERGHTVTVGPASSDFTGRQASLATYDATVILYPTDSIPVPNPDGVTAIRNYVQSGGRVLTTEPFNSAAGNSSPLRSLFPITRVSNYNYSSPTTFATSDAEPILNEGVADPFALDNISQGYFELTSDAKVFYTSRVSGSGLIGRTLPGSGRVLCFAVSVTALELQNPDFRRLFQNTIAWLKNGAGLPSITTSPTSLSFSYTTGAAIPASQTLALSSSTAQANFSVTATSTNNWLSVSPTSGTTPANVNATVQPTALSPGTYTGEIAIVAGSTVRIPVTLTVTARPVCTYIISPEAVNIPLAGGAGDIGVSTQAGCSWTGASNVPWLTISTGASGSGPGTVHYAAATNAAAASRQGSLTVAGQQFTVNQAGTALSFIVGPSPLSFHFTAGSAAQVDHPLYINPSAPGAAFTTATSGGAWLSVAPAAGTVPGASIVSVNPSGLSAGSYQGTVTVTVTNAIPPQQRIVVNLVIDPAGAPQLSVDSTTINLSSTRNGHSDSKNLQIVNIGSGNVVFRTAVSGGSWLSVQPDSGSASIAANSTLVVTANPQGLDPGTYTGRVVITPDNGSPINVDVFFTVTAATRTMLLSQSGLTFTAVAQGGAVPSQNFGILNTAEGVMDWSISATTLTGGSWLTLSSTKGATDAASIDVPLIDVGITASGLVPGEYHGLITVMSPSAANSPQIASVLLRVLPPGSDPGPVVRPTGLIFTAAANSTTSTTQEVVVSNLSATSRTFTSSRLTYDGGAWLTNLPVNATVVPAQPVHLLVQSSLASLSPGVRRGVVTMLFADGSVQNVNVISLVASSPTGGEMANTPMASSCGTPGLTVLPTSLRADFTATVGQATTVSVKVADECGRLLDKSGLVTAHFSSDDPAINLVSIGGGSWTASWRPLRATGSIGVEITALSIDGSTRRGGQISLTGSVQNSSPIPLVSAGGVVQAASFAAGVPLAPGSLVTVYGLDLADSATSAQGVPLPSELNSVRVVLGDRPLPLLFTSAGQVNVQVPFNLPVNTQHQIAVQRGGTVSVPETLSVAAAQPGIFTENQRGTGQGIILKSDQVTLAKSQTPATAGETIVVYCTGLGAVDPPVLEGSAAPQSPLAVAMSPVTLRIGGVPAQVMFAGLTPGQVGLYQINAVVPQVPAGEAVPVQIEVAGQFSPPVTMAIR
jgi:uncharacterized protein (TIGR03437 family)